MDNFITNIYSCCLFKNLSPEQIDKYLLNISYKIKSYKKNEVIFSESDIQTKIGIIINGSSCLQKLYPGGKTIILENKSTSHMIGESLVFSTSNPCDGEKIVASDYCDIFFIDYTNFKKLLLLDNSILFNYMECISNSIQLVKHRLGMLSLTSIQERIAAFLLSEYKKTNSNIIQLFFTKSDLAKYLDVSRTSLLRELKKMVSDGIISIDNQYIRLIKIERLNNILIK